MLELTGSKKIRKLSIFTSQFDDFKIITTLRDPVKSSFSFCVEAYEALSKNGQKSYLNLIENSIYMKIYDYEYLYQVLSSNFPKEKLDFLLFEDVFFDNNLHQL